MAENRLVGLIPAAGLGTRLGSLPGSKELLPVPVTIAGQTRPVLRPVCTTLLNVMRQGGIEDVIVILRSGKWDIPEYLGDGSALGMQIGYAIMSLPFGAPFTLDAAYPFVRDATVALGFPDVLIEPPSVYGDLLRTLDDAGADIALGLFPTDRPYATDMIRLDDSGRVVALEVRPTQTDLTHAWCIAVWRPRFTEFLHTWVEERLSEADFDVEKRARLETTEHYVGQVFQAAIRNGLNVVGIPVSDQPFLDIGTPETYARALSLITEKTNEKEE